LVIEVPEVGRTTICTVAFAPLAIVPSEHVTVPDACEQLPCDGVVDSYVTLPGSVSLTETLVAGEGPELLTVSV
jgi:hypothetical protein